jgi:N6-adenosine-specific RNA methylase IME4
MAVDEVMAIRDRAEQLAACARIANNHKAEADAVALRMRATRRLGQLMQAQKDSIGFNRGAAGGGKKDGSRGSIVDPRDTRPTLASQGIGKRLADQARVLSSSPDEDFEAVVADIHDKVARAARNAVREVEIKQEREVYRARTYEGGTVADLEALIARGFRAGVKSVDFPWPYETYSAKGKQRSAERHYETWSLDRIKAFAADFFPRLALPDYALFIWTIWPLIFETREIIEACEGFEYSGLAFDWTKSLPGVETIEVKRAGYKGGGLHWGQGHATRANSEVCLLATRGSPRRLSMDVHSSIIAPVGDHSEKPDEVYRRIERLYPGPYLELFARRPREGWKTWGDEVPPPDAGNETPPPGKPKLDESAGAAPPPDDDGLGIPTFLDRRTKGGAS